MFLKKTNSLPITQEHGPKNEFGSGTMRSPDQPDFISPLNQVDSTEFLSQNDSKLPRFKSRLYYLPILILGKLPPALFQFPSL
jgi:hypothetical protein